MLPSPDRSRLRVGRLNRQTFAVGGALDHHALGGHPRLPTACDGLHEETVLTNVENLHLKQHPVEEDVAYFVHTEIEHLLGRENGIERGRRNSGDRAPNEFRDRGSGLSRLRLKASREIGGEGDRRTDGDGLFTHGRSVSGFVLFVKHFLWMPIMPCTLCVVQTRTGRMLGSVQTRMLGVVQQPYAEERTRGLSWGRAGNRSRTLEGVVEGPTGR